MSTLQNAAMPLFASASGSEPPSWLLDGGDPLDVDMLAEYLLEEDGSTNGVTFDLKSLGGANTSKVVSPEQSEDGVLPPVSERIAPQSMYPQHPVNGAIGAPPQLVANVGLAPQFPIPGHPLVSPSMAQPLIVQQQQQQQGGIPKRRRVDGGNVAPMIAIAGAPGAHLLQAQRMVAPVAGRGRKKSQAQVDRRRERNRILARRTRLRKKFFFESLQKEVLDLQRENAALREIAMKELEEEESKKLLDSCDTVENLPSAVVEACGELEAELHQQDFSLVKSVERSQQNFIITDPCLQDNPIVFVSDGFLQVTGYTRENVLGRNCRFLQGPETSTEKVEAIRKSIATGEDVTVTMINYTAKGDAFWNKLFIAALRDAENTIVNYIGVVVRVAGPPEGDPEHGKLLPGEEKKGEAKSGNLDGPDTDEILRAMEGIVEGNDGSFPGL